MKVSEILPNIIFYIHRSIATDGNKKSINTGASMIFTIQQVPMYNYI